MAAERSPRVEIVSLTIPSRLELLGLLDKVADSISQRLEFDDESRSAISMSVVEAGTNAIQHGHAADAGVPVDVRFEMHPDQLIVTVHDRGGGFDPPRETPDMTSPEHLFDLRGRGIFIMRSCMDEVEFDFSRGGTTVRLVKLKRPSANGSSAG